MSFSFKYKPVELPKGVIYRPLIPLTFEGKLILDIFALIDSGSDMTLIPKDMADLLEISYGEDDVIFGISKEPVKVKQGKVKIGFGKGHENYIFEIPVMIADNKEAPIIIGRIGFFDQFKITFIESEKRVEFKKAGEFMHQYKHLK